MIVPILSDAGLRCPLKSPVASPREKRIGRVGRLLRMSCVVWPPARLCDLVKTLQVGSLQWIFSVWAVEWALELWMVLPQTFEPGRRARCRAYLVVSLL